jgi:hypothetical protein
MVLSLSNSVAANGAGEQNRTDISLLVFPVTEEVICRSPLDELALNSAVLLTPFNVYLATQAAFIPIAAHLLAKFESGGTQSLAEMVMVSWTTAPSDSSIENGWSCKAEAFCANTSRKKVRNEPESRPDLKDRLSFILFFPYYLFVIIYLKNVLVSAGVVYTR